MRVRNKCLTLKEAEEYCESIIERLKSGKSSLERESVLNGKFLAVIDIINFEINQNMLLELVTEFNAYNKFLDTCEKYSNYGAWQDWEKVEEFLLEY